LQDAELVAVWIREHVPGHATLDDGILGEHRRAQSYDAADLRVEVTGPQVKVNTVFAVLAVSGPLQEHLDAGPVGWSQGSVNPGALPLVQVSEHARPEARRALQVGAVDHDDEVAAQILVRLPAHPAILMRCRPWRRR
jgi:hypothetical protein